MLRAEGWPYQDRADQGVELVVDPLVELLDDDRLVAVRSDLLALIGQIDVSKAMQPAEKMLNSGDAAAVGVAIDVLSSERQRAETIAARFLNGQFPRSVQSHVAAGLQRHLPQDTTGKLAAMSAELFRDGLNVSLDPSEVNRITRLVNTTGDPLRGQALFLNVEKTQWQSAIAWRVLGAKLDPI